MARVTLRTTSVVTAAFSSTSSNGHKGIIVATITRSHANSASSRQKNNARHDKGEADPFVQSERFPKNII